MKLRSFRSKKWDVSEFPKNPVHYRPYENVFRSPDEISAKQQFSGGIDKYLPDLLAYFNEKESFESEKYHAWQSIEPSLWLLHIYESYTDVNNYKLVDCLVDDYYQVVVFVAQEYVVGGVVQEGFSDSPFYDYNNFLSAESREYKEDNSAAPGLMKYIKEYMPSYTFLGFSERPTDFMRLRDLFLTRMNSDPPRLPNMPIRSESELDAEIDAPADDLDSSLYASLERPGQVAKPTPEGLIPGQLAGWEPSVTGEFPHSVVDQWPMGGFDSQYIFNLAHYVPTFLVIDRNLTMHVANVYGPGLLVCRVANDAMDHNVAYPGFLGMNQTCVNNIVLIPDFLAFGRVDYYPMLVEDLLPTHYFNDIMTLLKGYMNSYECLMWYDYNASVYRYHWSGYLFLPQESSSNLGFELVPHLVFNQGDSLGSDMLVIINEYGFHVPTKYYYYDLSNTISDVTMVVALAVSAYNALYVGTVGYAWNSSSDTFFLDYSGPGSVPPNQFV